MEIVYQIKYRYQTGDSFHTENLEDVLEFDWKNLDVAKECLNRPEVLLKFKQPRKPSITAKNVATNEIKTLGRRQWHDVHQIDYRKLLKGYTSKGWKMVVVPGLEPGTSPL